MKKDAVKGFIVGCCVTIAIAFCIPVIAETTDTSLVFNLHRIKTATRTIVDWGQDYTLSDGREVPASVVYDNETYLHINLTDWSPSGSTSLWNGDTSTFTLLSDFWWNSPIDYVEKMDSLGNTWEYSIGKGRDNFYLRIQDINRGYARAYQLAGENAYTFMTIQLAHN